MPNDRQGFFDCRISFRRTIPVDCGELLIDRKCLSNAGTSGLPSFIAAQLAWRVGQNQNVLLWLQGRTQETF